MVRVRYVHCGLCHFAALRQQVAALSSQIRSGSLSKDGLGDLKRAVEAVEAAGMKNGNSASKPSAGNDQFYVAFN